MTHANFIEDNQGDLVDIEWYCSAFGYSESVGTDAYGHAYPGGSETDYDVHCHHCKDLMWHGLT